MPVSKLDTAYRSLVLSKFFTKGWGKPDNLKKLFEFRKLVSNRKACFHLVEKDYPVTITKEIVSSDNILLEGKFISPFERYLPGLLPNVSETAYFQVLLPKKWQSDHYKPVCLHLAGTGDHFFFRRRNFMAKPLLKEAGIGAILLENPFYGARKPKDQVWSCLHNVSDIFVMGGCLILESLVLFHWCRRNGLGPFGVTGISMGGHMASLAATNWPDPIVLVPCLSWTTASAVFTRGVMSNAINWELLEHQYYSDDTYSKEIKHMVKIVDNVIRMSMAAAAPEEPLLTSLPSNQKDACYAAGQHFAKNFPDSLDHVESLTSVEEKTDIPAQKYQPVVENIKGKKEVEPSTKIQKANQKSPEQTGNPNDKVIDTNYSSSSVKLEPDLITEKCDKSERDILKEVLIESGSTRFLKNLDEKNFIEKLDGNKLKITDYLHWKVSTPELKEIAKKKAKTSEKKSGKDSRSEKEKLEALQFMCGIMDECTHLSNFSIPVDTELVIAITARDDAYVPREGLKDIREVWPGSEVRYLNAGHVGAYLLHQKVFRTGIIDGFDRLKKKYYPEGKRKNQITDLPIN